MRLGSFQSLNNTGVKLDFFFADIPPKMSRASESSSLPVAVVQASDVAALASTGVVKRGISVTNKTEQNSSSLILTIGENYITQWWVFWRCCSTVVDRMPNDQEVWVQIPPCAVFLWCFLSLSLSISNGSFSRSLKDLEHDYAQWSRGVGSNTTWHNTRPFSSNNFSMSLSVSFATFNKSLKDVERNWFFCKTA